MDRCLLHLDSQGDSHHRDSRHAFGFTDPSPNTVCCLCICWRRESICWELQSWFPYAVLLFQVSSSLLVPSLPCRCLLGSSLLAGCLSRHPLQVVMQTSSADSAARDTLTFQLPAGPGLSEAAVIPVLTQVCSPRLRPGAQAPHDGAHTYVGSGK